MGPGIPEDGIDTVLKVGWCIRIPTRFFSIGVEVAGTNWKEGNLVSLNFECFLFGVCIMLWQEYDVYEEGETHLPSDILGREY